VRGDLLKRYPNTLVYAVEATAEDKPALKEYAPGITESRVWPIFSGSLPPDLTFLGFPKTPRELCVGGSSYKGYFIVLEERLGEPRFGFDDEPPPPSMASPNWWYNLAWESLGVAANAYIDDASPAGVGTRTPRWGSSAAAIANICLQRPVRVAIHASRMLSEAVCRVEERTGG
jgi:hypothetical protein